MPRRRHTADSITDDDLDALYRNANVAWRRGDRWKERAVAAEAAIERALSVAAELDYAATGIGLAEPAREAMRHASRRIRAELKEDGTP